jgi:transcriptional regulator with GAF, ATPase, and Fis domain
MRDALAEEKELFALAGGEDSPDENEPDPGRYDLLISTDARRILFTDAEAQAIRAALARNHYNKTRAARDLGLTRGQLEYRLKLLEEMNKK